MKNLPPLIMVDDSYLSQSMLAAVEAVGKRISNPIIFLESKNSLLKNQVSNIIIKRYQRFKRHEHFNGK